MKNLLKKLGVLSLIVAIISPYVYIPKVEAATSSECTNHLQTYLFLDQSKFFTYQKNGEKIMPWLESKASSSEGGYETWANFPYAFPQVSSDKKIVINSVTKNDLLEEDDLEIFWQVYNERLKNMSAKKIEVTNEIGNVFVQSSELSTNGFTKLDNYTDVSIIIHGMWSNLDAEGQKIPSNLEQISKSTGISRSLQTILAKENYSGKMRTYMKNAEFSNDGFETGDINLNNKSTSVEYFQDLVDGKNEEFTYIENGEKYISLTINRKLNMTDTEVRNALNRYVFGKGDALTVNGSGNGIYSSPLTTGGTVNNGDKVYKSYDALRDGRTPITLNNLKYDGQPELTTLGNSSTALTTNNVDFWTDVPYYWPAVLNVEYKVCPLNNEGETPTTQKWNLVYDANVEDVLTVTNMPSNSSNISIGTNATVDSKVPVREGYAFKGWCKGEKECSSPLKADDKITSPTSSTTITLYAQWGPSGTTPNKDLGLVSYVLGFAAVGLVAGGIYYISRKKNLFKQI